jgi:hypothetical protein
MVLLYKVDKMFNQAIKTTLPANVKKLLHEAETTLRPLKNSIEVVYKGVDGVLDPTGKALNEHIDRLQSIFAAVEDSLATVWGGLVGNALHEALRVNTSLIMLCNDVCGSQGIPFDLGGAGDALYFYEYSGVFLSVMTTARVLSDVIYDLRVDIDLLLEEV